MAVAGLVRALAMIRARNGRTKNGTRRMAGSVNRFSRNGRTASGRSGPPRLNSTTAIFGRGMPPNVAGPAAGSSLTHHLHQLAHMPGRRRRHDAVAEVEHERPPAHRPQD